MCRACRRREDGASGYRSRMTGYPSDSIDLATAYMSQPWRSSRRPADSFQAELAILWRAAGHCRMPSLQFTAWLKPAERVYNACQSGFTRADHLLEVCITFSPLESTEQSVLFSFYSDCSDSDRACLSQLTWMQSQVI